MRQRAGGFTLIEAIVVLSILGVVAAMVSVFIELPIKGYISASERAELTDIADGAIRRFTRDLRLAVPNSIRFTTVNGVQYLEFLQVKTGGIYRSACSTTSCTGENALNFATGSTVFDVLGGFPPNPAPQPAADDTIVVFNAGVDTTDAYSGGNTAVISKIVNGTNTATVTLKSATTFPFESPNQSFLVVDSPVTYACSPSVDSSGNGTGTLTRISGYTISAVQAVPTSGTSAVLANKVSSCSFTLPSAMVNLPGYGVMAMRLTLQTSNEKVSLYHEAHVNNVP